MEAIALSDIKTTTVHSQSNKKCMGLAQEQREQWRKIDTETQCTLAVALQMKGLGIL